jgi:ligand-binding sensor domain-containing protein
MLQLSGRWRLAAPAILVVLVLTSSWVCYRALRARDQAASESAGANRIAASFLALDSHARLAGEPIEAASAFRDATFFRGRVYLCSPGGLYGYDPSGALQETYRTGRELPPGELVALTTGRGPSGTELYLTTEGAGVLAFDGTRFHQLLPADARLRNFTAALGLNAGQVLFGTPDHGVLVWDGKTLAGFLPALNHAHITALEGTEADLWIGTLADGAYRLHAGQLDPLGAQLPDPHVLSIALSGASAYLGTPVGVVEFRDGRKLRNLAEGYFARSVEADGDTLAIGTEDEGMLTIPLHPGAAAAPAEFPSPVERIFRLDGIRYALAGSLYRSDAPKSTWTRVLAPEKGALADRNIASLAVAHDGRIWVGYFDRGLDIADANFENVRHFEDDHLFCVNRIVEEPGGSRTAVATANGLVMFDAASTVHQILDRKDGLLADHVTDVIFRGHGMVIATPAGLSIADSDGVRSLYVFHGLVNNHVYSLASYGARVAAGTLGGLSLLENDVVEANYTTANSGLKHNWISALARVGDDWFAGTYGAGVMRLDPSGEWHAFPELQGGFEVNPNAMALSGDTLYVGSLGKGLWIYSRSTGRWKNLVTSLPSLNVTAVAIGNGFVYAGTGNGLVRFREEELR